jgi:hypothetical protein
MKKTYLYIAPWLLAGAFFFFSTVVAQTPAPKVLPSPRPIVFAVIDSGKLIEPIGVIEEGKFAQSIGNDEAGIKAFSAAYYGSKQLYPIVFGGAAAGSLSVVKSNIGTECGGNSAEVVAKPARAKLDGFVMALATSAKLPVGSAAYRRRPTPAERVEIEKLVRAELAREGVPKTALGKLRYHNLTAVDVDGDEVPEFVGSYWVAPGARQRRTLFFIAGSSAGGKLALSMMDYGEVDVDDIMSGDVTDVDSGVGHILLLDVLDIDNDGVKEIFTIRKAFEGNNYYVYGLADGKWEMVHSRYAYRCGY